MTKETQKKIMSRIFGLLLVAGLIICGIVMIGSMNEASIGTIDGGATTMDSGVADRTGGMFTLIRPVFAQEMQEVNLTFLHEEAGISAHTNVGRQINLDRAETAFRTIERRTAEYIIGSVQILGKGEEWDAHVFVHGDGWMVAYYHRDRSVSKIVNWGNLEHTNLEITLNKVATAVVAPITSIGFYNFEFPTAQNMLIVTDDDTFRMKIPHEFIVHERSYSLRGDGHRWQTSTLLIGGQNIGNAGGGATTLGDVCPWVLHTGAYHTIIRGGHGGRVAIVLTYGLQ